MAKTQEELNQLKKEFDSLASKFINLTDEELEQVTGGVDLSDLQRYLVLAQASSDARAFAYLNARAYSNVALPAKGAKVAAAQAFAMKKDEE